MKPQRFVKCAAVAAVCAAALVIGCACGIKATSAYDERVNFSKYSTFFMLKGNSTGDPVVDERLATNVKATLMSKGWLEVPEGDGQTPDYRRSLTVHCE